MSATGEQIRVLAELTRLGEWASGLSWADVPDRVQDRLSSTLLSTLVVTTAGGRLPERSALVSAWVSGEGPCPVLAGGVSTGPEAAAWLNASAMVSLEMDEGNKHAAGHPAAHGFPAVLALAAQLDSDGPTTMAALAVAYEVSSRFGRATRLAPTVHPHGNWGGAGGAAGCARLLGLGPEATTAAMDAASGIPIAGPFAAALDGNPVRHEWMGATAVSALAAARLAQAGVAHATGIATQSLGGILGTFDPSQLSHELGERWDVELGYFKRHASCAFTHPAADAILELRDQVEAENIEWIVVEVPTMSSRLAEYRTDTRLAAMFSIPFVIVTALRYGVVDPSSYTPQRLIDPVTASLAQRVSVLASAELDARLPAERAARVTIHSVDGTETSHYTPNPVGDADNQPFGRSELMTSAHALLVSESGDDEAGDEALARITACVDQLPHTVAVRQILATLALR